MKILAHPTINDATVNPLNRMLYSKLEESGCTVQFFGEQEKDFRPDILHIHWPDHIISGDVYSNKLTELIATFSKYRKAQIFFKNIEELKRQNTKVVWTAHNVYPHQKGNRLLAKWFYAKYFKLLDGVIYLSSSAKNILLETHFSLRDVKGEIIPRGNFKPETQNMITRQAARKKLNIPEDRFVFLYFGWLRENKNAPELARQFMKASLPSTTLIIAGKERPNYESDRKVGDEVQKCAEKCSDIRFDRRRLSDEELLLYLSACDVVVLPYKDVLNSAVLLMTLSCNRPAILPRIGTLAELADIVGDEWVHGYRGDITSEILESAYREFRQINYDNKVPDLREFEWENVISKTERYFRNILS